MQTRGVWIIELSELDSLSNSDVARIKAFMSRTTDRFRNAFGGIAASMRKAGCGCAACGGFSMDEDDVYFDMRTGRPSEVASTLRRRVSAYTRKDLVQGFKIGITNAPVAGF